MPDVMVKAGRAWYEYVRFCDVEGLEVRRTYEDYMDGWDYMDGVYDYCYRGGLPEWFRTGTIDLSGFHYDCCGLWAVHSDPIPMETRPETPDPDPRAKPPYNLDKAWDAYVRFCRDMGNDTRRGWGLLVINRKEKTGFYGCRAYPLESKSNCRLLHLAETSVPHPPQPSGCGNWVIAADTIAYRGFSVGCTGLSERIEEMAVVEWDDDG